MRFLRSRTPTLDPPAEEAPSEPLAIFGVEGVLDAWVEPSPLRISDRLNRGEPLSVRFSPEDAWQPLATENVVALAVQPQPSPSPNRMARRRHVLEFSAEPYRIRGTVHMPPGADPLRYLRAAPQGWAALTDATIVEADGSGYEVEVLLVHMTHVSRL